MKGIIKEEKIMEIRESLCPRKALTFVEIDGMGIGFNYCEVHARRAEEFALSRKLKRRIKELDISEDMNCQAINRDNLKPLKAQVELSL